VFRLRSYFGNAADATTTRRRWPAGITREVNQRVREANELNSRWQRHRKMQSKQLRLWQKVVRGAHGSIKPGVKRSGTPGSRHAPISRARGAGDSPFQKPSSHLERSQTPQRLAPASRARRILAVSIPGLAPQALCLRALRALVLRSEPAEAGDSPCKEFA
jgi:hypothetical protein